MTLSKEIQKLDQDGTARLLEITYSGGVIRISNSNINPLDSISFDGNEYFARQFEIDGYDITEDANLPRPEIVIDNVDGFFYPLVKVFNDLKLASVRYMEIYLKNLDSGQEPSSTDLISDYEYQVRQRKSINPQNVTFVLGVPLDGVTAQFGIQALKNTCVRAYRSPDTSSSDDFFDKSNTPSVDCPYLGGQYFKEDGDPTSDWRLDSCGQKISDCRLRFGENADLPIRSFPSIGDPRK